MRTTTRLTTAAFCAALSLAVAVPGVACPVAQDPAASATHDVMPWQDLRTPDAQDAAYAALHP